MKSDTGIWRVEIESDWGRDGRDARLKLARDCTPAVDALYREICAEIRRPLRPGLEVARCTKSERDASYDWKDGIDRKLIELSGRVITAQDKILSWHENTLTFEDEKTSGSGGYWKYGTALWYSVFYFRNSITCCADWMIVNLEKIREAEAIIPWQYSENRTDGRRAKFRFVPFELVPRGAIVSYKITNKTQRNFDVDSSLRYARKAM